MLTVISCKTKTAGFLFQSIFVRRQVSACRSLLTGSLTSTALKPREELQTEDNTALCTNYYTGSTIGAAGVLFTFYLSAH